MVASAAALSPRDEVFSQYREHGVLLHRLAMSVAGHDSADAALAPYLPFMRQNVGSARDIGRARQMSMHYGDPHLAFQMVSSTVATQIPHAAGFAYALKRAGESQSRIAVSYFGDGGSSEGDFHAGLNFAATLQAPVLFLCRNNGFAISTPTAQQLRSDGIAGRAVGGYGVAAFRVDGNDAVATYIAVNEARDYIVRQQKPCLVELLTYRRGDHSTSDDSALYRNKAEADDFADPVNRLAAYLRVERTAWDEDQTQRELAEQRTHALRALEIAEKEDKPTPDMLFDDVYAGELPQALRKQRDELRRHLASQP